jgi:hypothetical protein
MASQWFIRGGEKMYGPIDDARLRRLAQEGKIDQSTEVSKEAGGPWHPAGKVRGLFPSPTPVTNDPSEQPPAEQHSVLQASSVASPSSQDRSIILRPVVWTAIALVVGVLAGGFLIPGTFFNARLPEVLQKRLQGSVFIVKADGESVRLGLTDIYLVPSDVVTEELKSSIQEYLKQLRSAESSIEYNSRPSKFDRAFSSPERAQRSRDERTSQALATKTASLSRLAELRSLLAEASIDLTKTDADGTFEFPIPATPPTSIVAYATRKIDAQSEHYFWIISSDDAMQQKPRLFLSNDNQLR